MRTLGPDADRISGPIRISVILSGSRCAAFEAETLAQLGRVDGIDVRAFVLDTPRRNVRSALERMRRHGLYDLYRAIDRRVFRTGDDASAKVSVDAEVLLTRSLPSESGVAVARTLGELALTALRAAVPDVLLTLASLGERERAATVARYGLWSYDHLADPGAFVRAVQQGSTTVWTTLRAERADGRQRVLYRSVAPTNLYSLNLTEDPCLWKSANFAARCIADLAAGGSDAATWWASEDRGGAREGSSPPANEETSTDRRTPTNREAASIIRRIFGRAVRRGVQRLFHDNEWFVAVRRRAPGDGPPADLGGFVPIEAPPGRFFADPVIWEQDGRHHVFVEDYSRAMRRGIISVIDIGADGRPGPARPVLERPYHLSYPFIARDDDGSILMIPESGDRRTVEAHRAIAFPDAWEPTAVLMEGVRAFDSTVLRHAGRVWLFASIAVRGGNPWDELFLFVADSVRGPWVPHPMNPIVSDVRSARPAGRVFEVDGRLIRPAQDCSGAYGRRVVLQEIVELTDRRYREEPWRSIEPTGVSGVLRTHCYTVAGEYEVVDGFRLRPRLALGWTRR